MCNELHSTNFFLTKFSVQRKSLLRIGYLRTFDVGVSQKFFLIRELTKKKKMRAFKMLTATIIVARVQPGTSKGITDLLLPQPSSVLKRSAVPLVCNPTLQIPMTSFFRKKRKNHEAAVHLKRCKGGNKRLRSRSFPSRPQGLLYVGTTLRKVVTLRKRNNL